MNSDLHTNPSSTIDYCGNMIYEGGALKQILVDGGYVTLSGSTPTYHYYLQDHLGNNRVVCNASSTVEQVNHYYPFGGLYGQSTNGDTQRYKYNGKELDRMHGLNWYDYGARHMAPDKNDNLAKDFNEKISSIQYNLLNLPQSITYSANKSATYTYDAEGNKLRVVT